MYCGGCRDLGPRGEAAGDGDYGLLLRPLAIVLLPLHKVRPALISS